MKKNLTWNEIPYDVKIVVTEGPKRGNYFSKGDIISKQQDFYTLHMSDGGHGRWMRYEDITPQGWNTIKKAKYQIKYPTKKEIENAKKILKLAEIAK